MIKYFTGFEIGKELFESSIDDPNYQSIEENLTSGCLILKTEDGIDISQKNSCLVKYSLNPGLSELTIGIDFLPSNKNLDSYYTITFYPHFYFQFNYNSNNIKLLKFEDDSEVYSYSYNFNDFNSEFVFIEIKSFISDNSNDDKIKFRINEDEKFSLINLSLKNSNFDKEITEIRFENCISGSPSNLDIYLDNFYLLNSFNENYLGRIIVLRMVPDEDVDKSNSINSTSISGTLFSEVADINDNTYFQINKDEFVVFNFKNDKSLYNSSKFIAFQDIIKTELDNEENFLKFDLFIGNNSESNNISASEIDYITEDSIQISKIVMSGGNISGFPENVNDLKTTSLKISAS